MPSSFLQAGALSNVKLGVLNKSFHLDGGGWFPANGEIIWQR